MTFKKALFVGVVVALMTMSADVLAQSSTQSTKPALSSGQQDAVRGIVRDYIRNNPEIILEAIETLQQREQAQQDQQRQTSLASYRGELERDPTSPVGGNPDGDVTIVEFFDYRCSFCKRVFPSIQELLKKDKNIRYVFKEFPILSPESRNAAMAALVVWTQDRDKYMEFHAKLMESHGGLSERKILRLAKSVGLDPEKISQGMKNPEIEQALQRNFQLAEKLGIRGTPAFIIGDKVVPGAINLRTMRQLVEEARQS